MTGSTFYATRARLVALVAAHASLPTGTQVLYEPPNPDKQGRQSIYVARTQSVGQKDATLKAGTRRRVEEYEHIVCCEVVGTGLSQAQTDALVAVLEAVVDDTVATNPVCNGATLTSGQQIEAMWVTGWETNEGPLEHKGHGRSMNIHVQVRARLL